MKKQIFTIGYEIPGYYDNYIDFNSRKSLMDADILVISPEGLFPVGNWINASNGGEGWYDIATSKKYDINHNHLKKEIEDFIKSGKNVFIILSKKTDYLLASSVSSTKGSNTYNTYTNSNYGFLPFKLGDTISASGKHIEFSGNTIFTNFYKKFKEYLQYEIYIENSKNADVIFTGKDKNKILGAVYKKENAGTIITLPYLKYDRSSFVKYDTNTGEDYWTDEAIKFGHNLVEHLIQIDQQLNQKGEKTPSPEWIMHESFSSKKSILISDKIEKSKEEIQAIEKKILKLTNELNEENILQDLLFEQGKPLENAVIKALNILGFQAENYNDGTLELDQVILSPEGYRYIGECEGKDNKDIDITKFRQLLESLNADFAREEVESKAFGILFGNPQRLENPEKRTLDFTQKCKIGAEREKIALIKTVDLFKVANYLNEHNKDEPFKKACRESIYSGLGKIVQFPNLPRKK